METTVITANGIVCGGCAAAAKKAVAAVPGVALVDVAVDERKVTVTHDGRADQAALVDAIKRAGFQAA